ncbi:hypothetical protein ABK040_001421 [Willaertia magna]
MSHVVVGNEKPLLSQQQQQPILIEEEEEKKKRRIQNLYRWINPEIVKNNQPSELHSSLSTSNSSSSNNYNSNKNHSFKKEEKINEKKLFPTREEILEKAKEIQEVEFSFNNSFGPIKMLNKEERKEIYKLLVKQYHIDLSEWKSFLFPEQDDQNDQDETSNNNKKE